MYLFTILTSSTSPGSNVGIYGNNSSLTPHSSSRWTISYNQKTQQYRILAGNSNCSLAVKNSAAAAAANVELSNYVTDARSNDEWLIVPIRTIKTQTTVEMDMGKSYIREMGADYFFNIRNMFSTMAIPFYRKWGVNFTAAFYESSNMPVENCSRPTLFDGCTNATCGTCGSTCNQTANTPNHHKNTFHNLYVSKTKHRDNVNCRFFVVAGKYCTTRTGSHVYDGGAVMSSYRDGKSPGDGIGKMQRTTTSENIRMLQHEFTHYFGPDDHEIVNGNLCILNGFERTSNYNVYNIENIWCPSCQNKLKQTNNWS